VRRKRRSGGITAAGDRRYDGYRTDSAACFFLYWVFPRIALSERPFNPCGKSARPTGRDIAVPISNAGIPLDNMLLASLPRDPFDRLLPHLSTVVFAQGFVLYEAGDEVDQVYFPHDGMLSLLAVLRDGKAIETATVGREGVVGAMAGLGLYKSLVRVVVQMPLACSKIAATHFRNVAAASDPLRNLCIRYNEVLLSQARVTAACNALHPIEARFCRWLLQSADRAASDTVPLTQEFLAEMLGVRRTSVTEVASRVQNAGVITYSRGVIKILDRPALLRTSCECYETLLDQSAVLA
jgi:CRP-like cAMP-binding protein